MSAPHTLEVPGFQVLQFLGSGARSTIWHVRDRRDGQAYALKRVVKREPSDYRFLEQAANECEVGLRLSHATIRKVHSLRRIKRWLRLREIHLVMEMCYGRTIQENRPLDVAEVVRIFIEVASALGHMNSQGYVHADIKPNNVIVSRKGTVKVIDLGQSCKISTVKPRIQGTPDFIAPEQVRRLPLDARTDVYNFGAAVYWALLGRPIPTELPRDGEMMLVPNLSAQEPSKVRPEIPAALSQLVLECIQVNPDQRPASMQHVGARLALIQHRLLKQRGHEGPPTPDEAQARTEPQDPSP